MSRLSIHRFAGLSLVVTLGLVIAGPASAQLTWYWDGASSTSTSVLQQITASMDEAVAYYNTHSLYARSLYSNDPRGIRVIYDSTVPTANASYRGRIAFGGSRGASTAMHEISHVLGVGTYEPTWTNRIFSGRWLGPAAIAELERFDGPGTRLNADGSHFWPYGLNFSTEDSIESRRRHVRMVGALRDDMGLRSASATELNGDYNNDGLVDAADYTVWRDRLGTSATLVNGFTVGSVEEVDYAWWTRGYSSTPAAPGTSIPEPTAVLVALAAIATFGIPARRGGRHSQAECL